MVQASASQKFEFNGFGPGPHVMSVFPMIASLPSLFPLHDRLGHFSWRPCFCYFLCIISRIPIS